MKRGGDGVSDEATEGPSVAGGGVYADAAWSDRRGDVASVRAAAERCACGGAADGDGVPGGVRSGEAAMKRGKPLAQVGKRATRDRDRRAEVVAEAKSACAGTCVAFDLIPTIGGRPRNCWNLLDPHEVISRGRRPGSHLEVELVVMVCRGHHDYITANQDAEDVRAVGLGGFHADEYDEAVTAVKRLNFRAAFGRWP